ncbi:hypothetical protein [Pseudonocardia lacus]|uniref:hypothetical protein n=1 Tax=Pseudonocardia lacus TaxID=2835865 RepID=UPI001BDD1274|nr:hypothetical protein [Pseudonocardia lacus]
MDDDTEARWRQIPPENEIPVVLPWAAPLGRTDRAAVALVCAEVHTTGVVLRIVVRTREHDPGRLTYHLPAVLIGVELADGSVAVAESSPGSSLGPQDPSLCLGGGIFGFDGASIGFLLAPLPPPGPLTLHHAWPDGGIPETSVRFDATEAVEAAAGVQVLWDPAPVERRHIDEPRPQPPEGGWFARTMLGE